MVALPHLRIPRRRPRASRGKGVSHAAGAPGAIYSSLTTRVWDSSTRSSNGVGPARTLCIPCPSEHLATAISGVRLTGPDAVPTLAPAMGAEARVVGLSCLRCRARFEESRLFAGCPRCRAEGVAVNLSVEYDLSPLAGVTPDTFGTASRGLWRFGPLLPVRTARPISLGEGATPLVHLERLGRRLGLPRLYAKDESQNPTGSDKDRLGAPAATPAAEPGPRVITIPSTGNHGASPAAYAARAGLPCVIFTLASVPETMKTLMQAYGAAVIASVKMTH